MVRPGFRKSLLCMLTLLFWFAQYVYIPFLTPYLMTLAISATLVGAIIGAYGVTQLLLRIPLGITLDIYRKHKLVILLGLLLAGLSSIGMLLFPSPLMLFIANAMSGVASSTWISFTILYASYYEQERSTRAIGIINVFFQAGILVAFLTGGLLFNRYGIQALFKASFASGILGTLLAVFIPRDTSNRGTNVTLASLLQVARDRRVITFSVLCGVAWFVVFATVFSFSTSTAKAMGASGTQLAAFSMLYSVGTIAGSYFIASRMAHRLSERTLLITGYVVVGLYCLGIALTGGLTAFYPLHLLCGLGNGILLSATMAFAVKEVEPAKKTTAMGFFQSIYCIGITGGPVVMGILIDHGSRAIAFCTVGAVSLLCALAVGILYQSGFLGSRITLGQN
nr:MFS transporter [uncultured Holophaga sp.]